MWESIARARSFLFVPGHRPDRFAKAVGSGADAIVLDLEDAVGPELKQRARENVFRWLAEGGSGIVRINGTDSPWYEDDVAMLGGSSRAVMFPKVTCADHISDLLNRLPANSCVLPVLETASGILRALEICAENGILRVVFGNADLASELGIDLADRIALGHARAHVVLASAACGLTSPVDGATASVTDEDALIGDAEHAAALGFSAKVCLHPRQVPAVNAAFTPSAADLQWARDVLAAVGDGSVGVLNSQVVGKPIIDRAQRMLSLGRP